MSGRFFSWRRFAAMTAKEFVQMRRDRLTFAIMLGIPLLQLIPGFINTDRAICRRCCAVPTTVGRAGGGGGDGANSYFRIVGSVERSHGRKAS
jgi:hypothetical protein